MHARKEGTTQVIGPVASSRVPIPLGGRGMADMTRRPPGGAR